MAHKRNTSTRQKHIPKRVCIACRQPSGKRELIRLVRTANGVEVDLTGKKAGRGAYLHPDPACWQVVLQSKRIEQALRTALSADDHRMQAKCRRIE